MSQRVTNLGVSIVLLLVGLLPHGTGLVLETLDSRTFLHARGKRLPPCKLRPQVTPVPTLAPPGPPPLVPGAPPPLRPMKVLPKLSTDMLPKLGPLPTGVPMPPLPTPAPPKVIARIDDGSFGTPSYVQPTEPPNGTIFVPSDGVNHTGYLGEWGLPGPNHTYVWAVKEEELPVFIPGPGHPDYVMPITIAPTPDPGNRTWLNEQATKEDNRQQEVQASFGGVYGDMATFR